MITRPDDSSPTRWSLVNRLKDWDDRESWKAFFDLYWKLICAVARQAGLTESSQRQGQQQDN
jgi:hypothetical protein